MSAAATGDPPPLDASTALLGLVARTEPERRQRRERRARRKDEERRRVSPILPLFLAGTMAVTANLTGVVLPAEARTKTPKPKPVVTDRGKTVREAFIDAKRAATAAASAIRATLAPPTFYTVGEHETIPDIAAKYGLSTASLLALNGLSWSSAVHAGQILKLTASGPIAPVVVAPEPPPVPQEQRHSVLAGESLSSIAAQYGVDVAWILSANGFSPSSIIYPGQLVTIPTGAPATPAPPADAGQGADAEPSPAPAAAHGDLGTMPLSDEMAQNAAVIVSVGRSMGVPDYGIVIALATAAQESTLRNLDWGDRDSVGLFQQRPSQGWGTVDELTNPSEAARRFYGGPGVPTMGLLDVPGWQDLPLTVAAQAVQVSAFPDAYAKWETAAWTWLAQLG